MGHIQCVAEMAVCRQNNRREGQETEVYGIVSNGQGWVFYRLTQTPEIFVSGLFTKNDLPRLPGALDHGSGTFAAQVPQT